MLFTKCVDFLFHQLLSNYFKEKETHEAKRVIIEENVIESFKKILETEESLTLYTSQVLFFRIQNFFYLTNSASLNLLPLSFSSKGTNGFVYGIARFIKTDPRQGCLYIHP